MLDNAINNNKHNNSMSCTVKITNNDNLDNLLAERVGRGSKEYIELASVYNSKNFKNYIANNNVDVNNVNTIYDALVNMRNNTTMSIRNIINREQTKSADGFSSYTARIDAINYIASTANLVYFNDLFSNKRNIKTVRQLQVSTFVRMLQTYANAVKRSNPGNTELASVISQYSKNRKYNELLNYLQQYNKDNVALQNLYTGVSYILNKDFFNEIANNKNVAQINSRFNETPEDTVNQESLDFEETGELIADAVDEIDPSLNQLTNTLGVIPNYEGHIEEIVRVFLNAIPKLKTTKRSITKDSRTGKDVTVYDYTFNDNLTTVEFEDYSVISNLLFTKVNNDNFDSFMNSLEEVANNIAGAESLIYIKDYLTNNKQFAYKFRMIFNRPIPNKQETVITEKDAPRTEVSNESANPVNVLFNKISLSTRNISINKADKFIAQLNKLSKIAKDNQFPTSIEKDNFVNEVYKIAKVLIPDITPDAIKKYAVKENSKSNAVYNNSNQIYLGFISGLVNLLDASKVYNTERSNYERMTQEQRNVYDTLNPSFFRAVDIQAMKLFAEKINKYLYIPVNLNSRNSEGNLQSDVLNRNYILTFNEILNSEEACAAYAKKKFAGTGYNYSNILIERTAANGDIIPGLFKKNGDNYTLTEYGKELMRVNYFIGSNDRRDYSPYLYKKMSKGDYFMTNLIEYLASENHKYNIGGKEQNIRFTNMFLSIPSDASNQFSFKYPLINLKGLYIVNEDKTRTYNPNHPLFTAFRNIIYQEILDAYNTYKSIFEESVEIGFAFRRNANGDVVIRSDYDENKMYENYEKKAYKDEDGTEYKGVFHKDKRTGKYILHGNVVRLSELDTKFATLDLYDNLLGNDKVIDILYGRSDTADGTGVRVSNGQLILNAKQNQAINDAVEQFISSYLERGVANLREQFDTYLHAINENNRQVQQDIKSNRFSKDALTLARLEEFVLNEFIAQKSFDDLFNGKSKFYKNAQDILKRLKEVQASGSPFGNSDIRYNELSNKPETKEKFSIGGREFELGQTFKAVTILNTNKGSEEDVINRIKEQLKIAGTNEETVKKLIRPYAGKSKTNDAQSYITLDEFIRRIYAAGELEKYRNIIEKLLDNTPLDQIDFDTLNKIQVQKNFYFDLHYDADRNIEVPRQIKNAEFVLIPKLIKGTELETVYNAMKAAGIDQLNTVETSKAAKNKLMELWDSSTGELTEENVNNFIANAAANTEVYSYTYLYRQQEVPSHLKDAENKIGIQVYKKLLDNIPNTELGRKYKQTIFRNMAANINASFKDVCAILNIPLDSKGNIMFDENGNIKGLNYERLIKLARENAARNGADKNTLDFLTTDENGQPRFPMYMNSISSKIENLVNGVLNRSITRQKMPGWHAAQVSDFGFQVDKHTKKDSRLAYRKVGKFDNQDIYYAEIRLPRWNKILKDIPLEELNNNIDKYIDEDARTMIGYRIPTEGKQSVVIMRVVEFLPDTYDSTVVLPDEWVAQSGSDFDVDSVYAMTFGLTKNKDGVITRYDDKKFYLDAEPNSIESKRGYLNYVKANIELAARKSIAAYVDKANVTKDEIKEAYNRKKEEINSRLISNIVDKINATRDTTNGVWAAAKELKGEAKKLTYEIANAIGNKPKGIATSNYINNVIENLTKLDDNGNHPLHNVIDNILAVFEEAQQAIDEQQDKLKEAAQERNTARSERLNMIYEEQFNSAETFAREAGIASYEQWLTLPVEDRVDAGVRNNNILDTFIKILSSPFAIEENVGTSNFDRLSELNEEWNKLLGNVNTNAVTANRIGSHDFNTQLDWDETASAGRTLKGVSVNLDTLSSIGNITKIVTDKYIPVIYDYNTITKDGKPIKEDKSNLYTDAELKQHINNLIERFGKDNVIVDGRKVVIKHNRIGWSNDNKNVEDMLITPYSSQTTAYILDVMKTLAIHNLNEYTFVPFKTMSMAGIDYDTALSILYQPIIDTLVRNVNESQGFGVKSGSNPLVETFVSIAERAGIKNANNINTVISRFEELYRDDIAARYGNTAHPIINKTENARRLKNEMNEREALIHDYVALKQFYQLREIGNILNNHLNVLTADKYGAKQTFYMNNKVFTDIAGLVESKNKLYSHNEETGEDVPLIEAIFPNIDKGIDAFAHSDMNQSVHPILATYLQRSTVLSVKIAQAFDETASDHFTNLVYSLRDYTSNGRLTEKQYKDYKEYLVGRSYLANAGYTVLTMPITYDNKDNSFGVIKTNDDKEAYVLREAELMRIAGIGANNDILNEFYITDINNVTNEEIDKFNKLTPAQKILYIQQNFGEDIGIFKYFDVNSFNDANYRSQGYTGQQIKLRQGNASIDAIHNEFNVAWNCTNPIIKLALADIVKYAYILENNGFKQNNVTRAVTIEVLKGFGNGGFNIAEDAKAGMENWRVTSSTGGLTRRLALGYIRQNLDTFNLPYRSIDRINKVHPEKANIIRSIIKYDAKRNLIVDTNLAANELSIEDRENLLKYYGLINADGSPQLAIKIKYAGETRVYTGVYEDGIITYIPINKLSSIDINKTTENSVVKQNNIYEEIDSVVNRITDNKLAKHTDWLFMNVVDENDIVKVETNPYVEDVIANNNFLENVCPVVVNPGFTGTVSFVAQDGYEYVATRMTREIADDIRDNNFKDANSQNYIDILNKYPNRNVAEDYQLHRIVIHNSNIMYSAISEEDSVAKVFKQATSFIRSKSNVGDEFAKNVIKNFYHANLDYLDTKAIVKNMPLAATSIADYFETVYADIIGRTNNFMVDNNGNVMSIDDPRVIEYIIKEVGNINSAVAKADFVNEVGAAIAADETPRRGYDIELIAAYNEIVALYNNKKLTVDNFRKTFAKFLNMSPNNFTNLGNSIMGSVQRVLADVENDNIKTDFFNIINTVNAIRNRFKIFKDLAVDGLDEDSKRAINKIKEIITKLENNLAVNNARDNWFIKFYEATSSNPMVKEQMMDIFTSYGDTSFLDMWIQDVHFNRNPIIQTVIKEVDAELKKAEISGKNEARDFAEHMKDIKSRAAKSGKSVDYNRMIKDGRFVRPYIDSFDEDYNKLHADYVKAVQDTNSTTSVEALRAKWKKDAFLAKHTISRYKPANFLYDENGRIDVIIDADKLTPQEKLAYKEALANSDRMDYVTAMVNQDANMLKYYPAIFSEYKKLLQEQQDIISVAQNGILNEEQDKQLHEIYTKIAYLTSTYYDDMTEKNEEDKEASIALRNYIANTAKLKEYYLDRKAKTGWQEQLDNALDTIAKYEKRDIEGRLIVPRDRLMSIPEYAHAKQWLINNANYTIDEEFAKALNNTYSDIADTRRGGSIFGTLVKAKKARDAYGIVDGRLFTDEEVAKLKDEALKGYNINQRTGLPYAGVLRQKENGDVIYNDTFYSKLKSNRLIPAEEMQLTEAANRLLYKAWSVDKKIFDFGNKNLTADDLKLIAQYLEAAGLARTKGSKEVAEFIETECEITTDNTLWSRQRKDAINRGSDFLAAWDEVFSQRNADGELVPNTTFYGTIKPKDENKYINRTKTDAVKFINQHTNIVNTEYYYEVRGEMMKKSPAEYEDWFKKNHVLNPYTKEYEPLRIWTTTEYVDDNGVKVKTKWTPKINQTNVEPRKETANPEWKENSRNYKQGSGYNNIDYDNLNEYEKEAIEYMQQTMLRYAFTNNNKYFVNEGYLPSLKKSTPFNAAEIAHQALGFIGFSSNVPNDLRWHNNDEISYDNDYIMPNIMLKIIFANNSKKKSPVPAFRNADETQAEFIIRREKVRAENAKIEEENKKIHEELLNTDWDEVFDTFIKNSANTAATQTIKHLLYSATDALTQHKSYQLTKIKGNLVKDEALSGENEIEYKMTNNNKAVEQVKNYIRRVIFKQYKETNAPKLLKFAGLMQNISGTKYMTMNITGGIANVLTGNVNIGMERLAREYFNESDYLKAQSLYFGGIVSYMSGMYSDRSSSLQDAIIKMANVVDYDRKSEVSEEDLRGYIKKVKGLMFTPQTIGEHKMQNTVLLAMMVSHRLVQNNDGNWTIMSKEQYHREMDEKALLNVLNEEQVAEYNKLKERIRNNEQERFEYNTFKKTIVNSFASALTNEQKREYIKERERLIKEADKDFKENHKDVYSQFEITKDGYAEIKSDSPLSYKEYAKFVNKVINVNKTIHGVYDKNGAALLETKWFGGMVMQFHKHLYPGFKKRYRWNAYYDESLGTVQKGAYKSLIDFISIPFANTSAEIARLKEQGNKTTVLHAIQTYCKNLIDFGIHINLNYMLAAESERANMRRVASDFIYTGAAIVGAIALTALAGGDDDNEEAIWYNLLMYHADRLASESQAYTPWGFVGEADKLWSSPVAASTGIQDTLKALSVAIRAIGDGELLEQYKTGRYANRTKLEVFLTNNTPVLRGIKRLQDLPNNNSYYKLNENLMSIVPVKEIGESLRD